jgi:nicotinamidase-related amidase
VVGFKSKTERDVVARLYYSGEPPFDVVPGKTALVIIDMQYLDGHRDYGFGTVAKERGFDLSYRFNEIDKIIPNIQQVMRSCRAAGIEVIHVRIAGYTHDFRDAPEAMRRRRMPPRFDTKEAQILDELAPVGDEIVLSKTTTSAFTSTTIDFILHTMGIQNLFVCGIVTGGCVGLTAKDADDRGYHVIVSGDCCAANSQEAHDAALREMNDNRMRVKSTAEVLSMIEAVPQVSEKMPAEA